MSNKYKKGFHITKRANLPSISKNGLAPKIGRRSASINEHSELLCFTSTLRTIPIWKDRLYKDIPYEELAVLSFDLDGIEYVQRYDNSGDFFTKNRIPPEIINVIKISNKSVPDEEVSLEQLKVMLASFPDKVSNSQYEILEMNLSELNIPEMIMSDEQKNRVIDELAAYEHTKWNEWQDKIHWHSTQTPNGDLAIAHEDVEKIELYSNMEYGQTDEAYKQEIKKTVMKTFYIMEDNNLIQQTSLSDEEIISILEQVEHARLNGWAIYMLSGCNLENGIYIIPAERAAIWKCQIQTPFSELTEREQNADRNEVYEIFKAIEEHIKIKNINSSTIEYEEEVL